MKKLFGHWMFLVGLAIRLALIFTITSHHVSVWYAPFIEMSISSPSFDPWSIWLASGGTPMAFPYGSAMWVLLLPITIVAKLMGFSAVSGYMLSLLAADICLLLVLNKFIPNRHRLLLIVYWLSPIVILATYGFGLNDIIPALLLIISVLLVRNVKLRLAGLFCAAAISAKISMVVALPFFAIYLFNNRPMRQRLPEFIIGFAIGGLVLGLPFLFSISGISMLFGNPELEKVYHLNLDLAGKVSIYIVPLIYMVMLYMTWRVRRLNFDLFQAMTGMAFFIIVLMIPASPGWMVWSMPFLALYQMRSGRTAILLIGIFSLLYVLSTLLVLPVQFVNGTSIELGNSIHISGSHTASLLHTMMVAIGLVLAIRMWRQAIHQNDFFRLSRTPFVLGIAGDSGSGKDTLTDSIADLFGNHSVVKLLGDDYHLWDRQKPMWQVMTHLNPMANNLEGFCNDLVSLTDGKSIQSKHYNHATGKMSKPHTIKSNDFIIASGLHALYLPMLRSCYHLKIYLDIDENLRRYFKIQRDVNQRGHSINHVLTSFAKREPDAERFIHPQAAHADLIFSLQPIHYRMLENIDKSHPLRLKLVVTTRHGMSELSIHRVLVGVCGLHVDIETGRNSDEVRMTIEGEPSSADVAVAAEMLCQKTLEFLDIPPKWQDGMIGIMQLITLSHISQAMTKRFI